jgi:hypothetical protein
MAEQECETCIYTFPYWFWTCKNLKGKIYEMDNGNISFRIYNPFLIGKLEDLDIYRFSTIEIPVLEGAKNSKDFIYINSPILFPHLDGSSLTAWIPGEDKNKKKFDDPYPANSIRIDYFNYYSTFDDEIFIGNLLEWIRYKTGIFWIGKVLPSSYRINKSKFKSNSKGEQRSNNEVSTRGFTLSGNEKALSDDIWTSSLNQAIQDKAPPLFQTLYLDARFMHFTRDYRRAVLNCAITCEEALKFFARWYYMAKYDSENFKFNKHFSGSKLTHNLDKYSKDFFGVSLKEENKPLYEIIEMLWIARHSTAHSANAIIRENGNSKNVTDKDSIQFINAVGELIKWLEKVTIKF